MSCPTVVSEHGFGAFDELEGDAPRIAHDGDVVAVVVDVDLAFGCRAGFEQASAHGGDVIHVKGDVEGEGINRSVIRHAGFGVEIEFEHHLPARVREEMAVAGRAELAGDGHAEVLAIPSGGGHGVGVIEAEMLKIHGDIVR